jgi:hypothetical protein
LGGGGEDTIVLFLFFISTFFTKIFKGRRACTQGWNF